MQKLCKSCNCILTLDNRAGLRRLCKPCRSKQVMAYDALDLNKRRKKAVDWLRKSGRVKQWPCLTCQTLCYKKYALAFCSDRCRFMHYVEITDTCWIWKGATNRRGYGKLSFNGNNSAIAHRVAYELFNGPIDLNKYICHTCDNPSCVRPGHLWVGTAQDNKKDQLNKDRGGVKLNSNDVLEIRKLHQSGIGSMTIARLFDVTCATISSIIKRRIWKHV